MADTHPITFNSRNSRDSVVLEPTFTESYQRIIGQTSSGMFFHFLITGTGGSTVLKYRTQTAGVWSDWTTAYTTGGMTDFDIYINSDDNLYMALATTADIKFIKLTHSSGSFSAGTPVVILTAIWKRGATITKRTDGDFYITFHDNNVLKTTLFAYNSSNDGANWSDISKTPLVANIRGIRVLPKGNVIWAVVRTIGTLEVHEYDSSWDAGTTIATGLGDATDILGVGKVSDTEIYAATEVPSAGVWTGGIVIFKYTGSWDGGTYLSTGLSDFHPGITVVNGYPTCFWKDQTFPLPDNLYYRTWNGSSWDSAVEIKPSPVMNASFGLSTPDTATKIAVVFNYSTPSDVVVYVFIQEATSTNEAIIFYTKTNQDPVVFYAEA